MNQKNNFNGENVAGNGFNAELIAFQNWFGDSKVVDEHRAPLRLFHGTKADFLEFDPEAPKRTRGGELLEDLGAMFFTDSPDVADAYAGVATNYRGIKWSYPRDDFSEGRVIPVYLSIKNPLIIDANDSSYVESEKQVAKAKADGYDGVIIRNVYDSPGAAGSLQAYKHTAYIVFRSDQIKNSIGIDRWRSEFEKGFTDDHLRDAVSAHSNLLDSLGELRENGADTATSPIQAVHDALRAGDESKAIAQPCEVKRGCQFKDELTAAYSGQTNHRLTISDSEGCYCGKLEYTMYEGKPAISLIEVPEESRRKGYGSELVLELQRTFPNSEIEWGWMTNDGQHLRTALQVREMPSEFADQFSELEVLIKERTRSMGVVYRFYEIVNPSDLDRLEYLSAVEPLNDLNDKIDELEGALFGESPVTRIIVGKMSDVADTVDQANHTVRPRSLSNAELANQYLDAVKVPKNEQSRGPTP